MFGRKRIGLVGCVSQKRATRSRAGDLYVSPLFRGRRQYVESSCDDWFILSARHGMVERTTMLEPYDLALNGMGRATKRNWADDVLQQIEGKVKRPASSTFEIHAGADYFDSAQRSSFPLEA